MRGKPSCGAEEKQPLYRKRQLLFGAALAVSVLLFSIIIALNLKPIYWADIGTYDIMSATGLDEAQLKENYEILIDYNNIFGASVLEMPYFDMSEGGRIHFEEVRRIFVAIQVAAPITAVLAAIGIVHCKRLGVFRYLKYGAIMTVAVPAVAAAFFAINWDLAFVIFHRLFFHNDYWIFDAASDPVILALPDGFFMHEAVAIVAFAAEGAALSAILYVILRMHKKHMADRPSG